MTSLRQISYWKLKLFCEAYTCQSYTQAAENLQVSQTTVTKAIGDIEHLTKKTLFVFTQGAMMATKDGDDLFQRIKNSVETIEHAMNSDIGDPFQTLAIAGNHSVCCTVFPITLKSMRDADYDISHFGIYNTDPQNAVSLIRRQIIQAAMFPFVNVPDDLRVHATATADTVLLVHKDHHFLKRNSASITMDDIRQENFLLIDDYKINDKYREFYKEIYTRNKFKLHNADWEMIMHFVGQGLGICPLLDIPLTNPNIKKIHVSHDIVPPITYSIVTSKNIHEGYLPALDAFISHIISCLKPSTYTL